MKLEIATIKAITCGADRVELIDGYCNFFRFNENETEKYKNRNDDFYRKSFATSGITLRFKTDSTTLGIGALTEQASSRTYFALDVFVNGLYHDSLQNFCDEKMKDNYPSQEFSFGAFSKCFELGLGEKEVCVYLPWSVALKIGEITIDDGAYVEPVKYERTLLAFGDSITHGYDALHPVNKYITRLAESMNAQEYNKAIAGEIFFPDLAADGCGFTPDYVTVAYGTNDWTCCTREEFIKNCSEFLQNVCRNYPDSKIYVITPIWRSELNDKHDFGDFTDIDAVMRDIAKNMPNIRVVSGLDLVPWDKNMFGDLIVHPNDTGFKYYFENLKKKIQE